MTLHRSYDVADLVDAAGVSFVLLRGERERGKAVRPVHDMMHRLGCGCGRCGGCCRGRFMKGGEEGEGESIMIVFIALHHHDPLSQHCPAQHLERGQRMRGVSFKGGGRIEREREGAMQ